MPYFIAVDLGDIELLNESSVEVNLSKLSDKSHTVANGEYMLKLTFTELKKMRRMMTSSPPKVRPQVEQDLNELHTMYNWLRTQRDDLKTKKSPKFWQVLEKCRMHFEVRDFCVSARKLYVTTSRRSKYHADTEIFEVPRSDIEHMDPSAGRPPKGRIIGIEVDSCGSDLSSDDEAVLDETVNFLSSRTTGLDGPQSDTGRNSDDGETSRAFDASRRGTPSVVSDSDPTSPESASSAHSVVNNYVYIYQTSSTTNSSTGNCNDVSGDGNVSDCTFGSSPPPGSHDSF
ncbi:hypothetical protein CONPUDRAFT_143333 [Coniophora puteana RWD-64-598 SS2]|uniref:Uncharacterized protein n=1 Tax=Coniophora puteana (strain RWD-64-598) TaxID=741705 RepID=A0A5M3MWB5_CONPW|nr:uncharacterized protein CONPUDRAFT_143333 [Coniophora puteana RWD-64-598 SS2]EIW83439.1 hypothetical protein CONPUDRAFT_143333 [Coniophora puteana RWD-64-598 SS2]